MLPRILVEAAAKPKEAAALLAVDGHTVIAMVDGGSRSVDGVVNFAYPAIYRGKEVDGIHLICTIVCPPRTIGKPEDFKSVRLAPAPGTGHPIGRLRGA
jgi:hypothetical protein